MRSGGDAGEKDSILSHATKLVVSENDSNNDSRSSEKSWNYENGTS